MPRALLLGAPAAADDEDKEETVGQSRLYGSERASGWSTRDGAMIDAAASHAGEHVQPPASGRPTGMAREALEAR